MLQNSNFMNIIFGIIVAVAAMFFLGAIFKDNMALGLLVFLGVVVCTTKAFK